MPAHFYSLSWITLRVVQNNGQVKVNASENEYLINYSYTVRGDADYWVKSYIPQTDERQKISLGVFSDGIKFEKEGDNEAIAWDRTVAGIDKLDLSFQFTGRPVAFHVAQEITYQPNIDPFYAKEVQASTLIQSEDEVLIDLANGLRGQERSLIKIIEAFYDYTYHLPSNGTNEPDGCAFCIRRTGSLL